MRGILSKAVSGVILTAFLTGMLASTLAVTSDGWVWVRDTVAGDYGEAVIGTREAIYIARNNSFYRYNPADDSWTVLAAPPNPDAWDAFKTGTALAWDFDDHIYALYGAATHDSRRWFYRYSISSNSWEALANTTADQGEGDAMAWCGLHNCIYAAIGGEQRPTYFVRYDPSTGSWSDTPADPPKGMGDGASLVWTGGNFLYALRGEFNETSPLYDFWRYNLVNNTWESVADIPAYPHDGGVGGVGDGGSLLYIGFWLQNQTDYIYALSGNQAKPEKPEPIPDDRFYRYTISIDRWKRLADLPFGVGDYVGCRLGYADGHIYAWQGTPDTWGGGGNDLARYEFPALVPPVVDFSYLPKPPVVNETVTFNASASHDPDGFVVSYTWDFGDDFYGEGMIAYHNYSEAGIYNVTLAVTDDDGLNNTACATVTVLIHDVTVVSVTPSTNEAYEGQIVNVTVAVKNKGNSTETFNVTAYARHQILEFIIIIQTKNVTNLPLGNQTTLTLSWNTTDVTLGNYTISAEASVVPGETYATDNVKVNGIVQVIPEFASMLLLFAVFAATMTVSMFTKRKLS